MADQRRIAPAVRAVVAHGQTWRPYTLGYPGLAGLAGAVLADPHAPGDRLAAAWLVPTLGWLAGLYGGDYFDRELDAAAKPHRPIPSGRIPARTALGAMIVLAASGAVIGSLVNWRTVALAALALGAGISYSAWFKSRGLAGNLVRGSLIAFVLGFGAMMTRPYPPLLLAWPAAIFVLHDTVSNLAGTLRDTAGDRRAGYATLPARRGERVTLTVMSGLSACWLALAFAAPFLLGLTPRLVFYAPLGLVLVLASAAIGGLVRSARPIDPAVALRAHEVLSVERLLFAAAFVALAGRAGLALAVLAPAVLTTLAAQAAGLRYRHEFGSGHGAMAAGEILGFVDRQIAVLATGGLPALAGWDRKIEITITDLGLHIHLIVADGRIARTTAPAFRECELPAVGIITTAPVMRDIFITARTSPRRAYLSRLVRLEAAPRDLLSLNQIFNEFRRLAPVPVLSTRPRDESRDEPQAVGRALSAHIVISDTTLRDGEQMPGVAFSPEEKLEIARRLDAAGIPLIEVGYPAVSAQEMRAIRTIVDAGLGALIQVIARPRDDDIDLAVQSGAQSIAVFTGTSPLHLAAKLRTTHDQLIARVTTAVTRVKQAGRQAVFAAEDATRTDPRFLADICEAVSQAGADAIGLADTAGVAGPEQMAAAVATAVNASPLPVAVHCHDDLGLATANSLAALSAGASGVQCSLLGIGERAGNAATEQIALALEVIFGRPTGLDLSAFLPLTARIAQLAGVPVPPTAPVVGAHAFVHESGLHVDGIVADPATYEPYPPGLIGARRQMTFGKHSGRAAVADALARRGLSTPPSLITQLLREVKQLGEAKHPLDEAALIARAAALSSHRPEGKSCDRTSARSTSITLDR